MAKKLREIVKETHESDNFYKKNYPKGGFKDAGKFRQVDHSVASGVRQKRRSMNDFIGQHIENSNITHDGLRKKFIKHYGQAAHDKHFEKLISKHVD